MDLPAARTFADLLDEMATRYEDRDFVVDHRRRLGYKAFRAEARAFSKGLHALGIRRGHKVALLMGNQAEWLVVDFAVTLLGGTLVALNTWWRSDELRHALAGTDASILVMVDRYLGNDYVARVAELDLPSLPQLRTVIGWGQDRLPHALDYQAVVRLGATVPDGDIDSLQQAVSPDDTALLLFTSGSTARSKAVRLTHRDSIVNMHAIGERMHLCEQDRMLVPTSLFWSLSCLNALFAVMTHGGTIVLLYRYDAGEMLRLIEAERCTGAYTLPQIVLQLHAHPDRVRRDLSRWRTGICRNNMIERMAEIGPKEMITGYGLTECYGQSVQTDGHDPIEVRKRNVGRPLPGVELDIVDPETRVALPSGTVGEIRLRGRVTPGYYNDPERTRECIDSDGWFYTGDIGIVEEDGSLSFKGRFKDVIKTGGINVTPADVEDLLLAHPSVEQAVVVGVPDEEREEIVAALVVPREGSAVTVEQLLAHCRQAAAAFKVPRFIQIVTPDAIPLTDTGKVHKMNAKALMTDRYRSRDG